MKDIKIHIWLSVPLPVAVVADMETHASILAVGLIFEGKWSIANVINAPTLISNGASNRS